VYAVLLAEQTQLPDRLRRIAPSMARLDWLGSYRYVESVHAALDAWASASSGNALLGAGEALMRITTRWKRFPCVLSQLVRFARLHQEPVQGRAL